MIWTVAKKELRGYFNSAVAVIFLAAFLAVTLYTFFWQEKFFARGIADLRPLFEWMPMLLIILASALAMRQWADERRAGTLEVLLTLPVPRWKLVAGKFLAGVLLIAVALGLTLGLPITISQMGNLDTGPVIGGYLAALLLSGAYLAIGMCVSAATDNQIVAFVGTALVCGVAWGIGAIGTSDLARALGTGTRFDSVARGVLDLRDLVYYGTITAIGLALNVLLLGMRTWGQSRRARGRRLGAILGVALIGANALALNLWLAPIGRVRLDLTEDRMYSLSSTTRDILHSLDERLLLRGYFSEKTHPLLAPLIPQIRDLLDEYQRAGGARLRVEFIDPTESNEVKREAKERFNIDSTPLPFTTQTEQSVVNAYFAIAIEYGDQHEVLGIEDLIQVRAHDLTTPEVSLRNLEYQITQGVKKVVANFSSLDSLFATTKDQIRLTAYLTPKTLPDQLKEAPDKLKKVADELAKDSKGKFVYTVIEPKIASLPTDPAQRAAAEAEAMELRRKHGARPNQILGAEQIFYFYFVLETGKRMEVITPPKDVGEAAFKEAIVDALKRGAPGFRKVVGLWTPPAPPPMNLQGMQPQRMPPPQQFQQLQKALSSSYEVRAVDLDAKIPDEVEVLVMAGPSNLEAKEVESVDQFVMRGGSLVLLAGGHRLVVQPFQRGPVVEKGATGLEPLLEKWGIKIGSDAVLDDKNESLLLPQQRDLGGGLVIDEYANKPYSLLIRVTSDQLASSVITGGLAGAVMAFASPVSAERKVGEDAHTVEELLRSSGDSWLAKEADLPNYDKYPEGGVPGAPSGGERRSQTLAVTVTGGFASGVAKPSGKGSGSAAGAQPQQSQLLEHSPPDTRIAVFGSSSFVSDMMFAQRLNSDLVVSNIQLVQNAIDWAIADTDLLKIRARTPAARAITIDTDSRASWRNANLIIAFLALAGVVGLAWFRRRAVKPFTAAKEA